MRARVCVRASSLRGAREQAPPHRRGGGAKLQNIVSHRSACKLPGIYLIRGQSVYTRLPFRGREKCPREERASKRCSASVAALLVFFFSFFFLSYQLGSWHSSVSRRIPLLQILYSQDSSSAYAQGNKNESADSTLSP